MPFNSNNIAFYELVSIAVNYLVAPRSIYKREYKNTFKRLSIYLD